MLLPGGRNWQLIDPNSVDTFAERKSSQETA
jgi:hypothetical protein